jgi:glycosyltransferase involved in cell wall biosynthesis
MPVPKYSVCMTCYNEAETVRASLNSLLGQLNDNYEVVIVDNFSKDGTCEVLREYEKSHDVKVIQRHCSRGLGRQFAFEYSSGSYIIANLDLDDIFLPVLDRVMTMYHQKAEGKLLVIFNTTPPPDLTYAWVQNMTIVPRQLVATLGGWRDLNIFEDWDIWSRAERAHKYLWSSYRFAANETFHSEPKSAFTRLVGRYERYRIRLRLGRRIFSPREEIGMSQTLAYLAARLSMLFQKPLVGQNPEFKSEALAHFVDFRANGQNPGEAST